MDIAFSINNIPIRLTEERWRHISVGHPEMADYYYEILETIQKPNKVYTGNQDEFLAVSFQVQNSDKHIVVVYKEVNKEDGFIITAFISNKLKYLKQKEIYYEHTD